MKFKNIDEMKNFNKKNKIKFVIITEETLFNLELVDIIKTYPNLNSISFDTINKYDSSLNFLIDELCISNISYVKIDFKYDLYSARYYKDIKGYDYKKTRIKRTWNKLSFYDPNSYINYDNLPENINLLTISSNVKLILINLPINLLKIEINSQFVNCIWGMDSWKIPFNCEVYYNQKIIKS